MTYVADTMQLAAPIDHYLGLKILEAIFYKKHFTTNFGAFWDLREHVPRRIPYYLD